MSRDGKGSFYKKLKVDKETRNIIREFRSWKKKIINKK